MNFVPSRTTFNYFILRFLSVLNKLFVIESQLALKM